MARYRTYKNGITGHRYKGYYIIHGEEKGQFAIWDKEKNVVADHILDYDECEWEIDKLVATPEEMRMLKQLYAKEIYQLSSLFIDLMEKRTKDKNPETDALYRQVEKIRKRKTKEKPW